MQILPPSAMPVGRPLGESSTPRISKRTTRRGTGDDDLPEREREPLAKDLAASRRRVLARRSAALAEARDALRRSLHEQHRLEWAVESAVREERNRIAREIHDTIAHALVGVVVQLRNADCAMVDGALGDARQHQQQAVELAREGLDEARRSIRGLRQSALDDVDLCIAAAQLVEQTTSHSGLTGVFTVAGQPKRLPRDTEGGILRIIQEALTNVLRHAHATEFRAELVFHRRAIRLNLRDDGCGFDPIQTHDGFGLIGIKERAATLRGRLSIASALGQGTTIVIVLPYR